MNALYILVARANKNSFNKSTYCICVVIYASVGAALDMYIDLRLLSHMKHVIGWSGQVVQRKVLLDNKDSYVLCNYVATWDPKTNRKLASLTQDIKHHNMRCRCWWTWLQAVKLELAMIWVSHEFGGWGADGDEDLDDDEDES